MTIKVLVCCPDGTQKLENREVPDNWFDTAENKQDEPVSGE